jgi:hypothetical protein
MPDYLEQGAVRVQLRKTTWQKATGVTLCIGQVAIVDAAAAGAFEFATDRAG